MKPSLKTKVKRAPKRGFYDVGDIYPILDNDCLCHVGLMHNGAPVVIPTLYGRDGDSIYIHGASASRLMTETEKGIDVSVSVATVTGLVLARRFTIL
ncbi:MAG: nitroimidazol reductase NimA-like FMN-containing flavoprotein [Bacteroidia bacterium]|jgi:nitroimidazol reductase NimA-like FMN-containing flavoprotein (pyridoxamine 5'-phosphate oxidase superfamily)